MRRLIVFFSLFLAAGCVGPPPVTVPSPTLSATDASTHAATMPVAPTSRSIEARIILVKDEFWVEGSPVRAHMGGHCWSGTFNETARSGVGYAAAGLPTPDWVVVRSWRDPAPHPNWATTGSMLQVTPVPANDTTHALKSVAGFRGLRTLVNLTFDGNAARLGSTALPAGESARLDATYEVANDDARSTVHERLTVSNLGKGSITLRAPEGGCT